jgi:hypothetical protein
LVAVDTDWGWGKDPAVTGSQIVRNSLFSILAIWLVVTIAFSGFVAVYLAFSTRVSEHFDPGSGW